MRRVYIHISISSTYANGGFSDVERKAMISINMFTDIKYIKRTSKKSEETIN
jgi:hypothetical protein